MTTGSTISMTVRGISRCSDATSEQLAVKDGTLSLKSSGVWVTISLNKVAVGEPAAGLNPSIDRKVLKQRLERPLVEM
ncbi:hypothetical protein YC2023_045168 [Brassica napus]